VLNWELVESIDKLDATYSILLCYWLAYFSLHKVVKVKFHITAHSFSFAEISQLGAPERYDLSFVASCQHNSAFLPQFTSNLFKLVASCNLSSVISLRMYSLFKDETPKGDPAFLQFILSLSSLNVLFFDSCNVLDLLPQLPIDACDVLPSLNTLKLRTGRPQWYSQGQVTERS